MLKSILIRICFAAAIAANAFSANILLEAGSDWRYWDQGSEPSDGTGSSWKAPGFNDSTWANGFAELGYGDGDETAVVSFGPNASAKYITTYFRKTFTVSDLSAFSSITLRLTYDDGAVVYLNGVEVARVNMPGGAPSYSTLASAAIEESIANFTIAPSQFNSGGQNVLAIEMHQASGTSSDISFDLELLGQGQLLRGPYLQMATTNSIIVRWRTGSAAESIVRYRTLADGSEWQEAHSTKPTTEHEVKLTGLLANTGYEYAIATPTVALASGPNLVFYTAPEPGGATPIRIWALGDSGTADANAAAVRDAYFRVAPTDYTDVLLMLGDNAYNNGLDSEYQAAVFDMYPQILQQSALWPTIGNHDTAGSTIENLNLPYFHMFTLPTLGEAGGESSGTEKYYSFNYGNVHFVCLDSMTSSREPNDAMVTWLHADLSANTLPWVIAFWHHPPYSKGSHDSDNTSADYQLVEMRQNIVPVLESYNVDLILGGHSHSYERSFLLAGHYGFSSSLTAEMKRDSGSGRADGTGSYNKETGETNSMEGAVYIVAGSSGKKSGGALNHPAMFVSTNELGSLVIDIVGNKLDVKFINETGALKDYFSLVKDNARPICSISSPVSGTAFTPGIIEVIAEASDSDGTIAEVILFASGTPVGTNTTAPYTFSWDATYGAQTLIVRARDDKGVTAMSAPVTVLVPEPAPAAPGNLVATAVSSTQINLTWSDLSANESGFRVERSTDGIAYSLVTDLSANTTSFANTGLAALTTYYYRVSAFNSGGVSDAVTASATTLNSTPAAPTNLSASNIGTTQMTLTWMDRSSNENGFRIERKSGKNWSVIATVGANTSTATLTGLSANTVYVVRVQAFNEVGVAYSNELSVKTTRR